MNEIISIGCVSTLFFGTLLTIVFGFFALLRYMRYKETMALAEKGLVNPRYTQNGKGTLRWGIVVTALGIALCLGLYPLGWVAAPGQFPLNLGPWMLFALVPLFFGLALILIYVFSARQQEKEPEGLDMVSEGDTNFDPM